MNPDTALKLREFKRHPRAASHILEALIIELRDAAQQIGNESLIHAGGNFDALARVLYRACDTAARDICPPGDEPALLAAAAQVVVAAERWDEALAVSIDAAFSSGGDHDARSTSCYQLAECDLRDAIEGLHVSRGEAIRSDRVLPSFGDLEQAARARLEPPADAVA